MEMRSQTQCANCGIVIMADAAGHDEHPIRELYQDDGYWCEACFFREDINEPAGDTVLKNAGEFVEKHAVIVKHEDELNETRYFDSRQAAAGSVGGNKNANYIGARMIDPLILDL